MVGTTTGGIGVLEVEGLVTAIVDEVVIGAVELVEGTEVLLEVVAATVGLVRPAAVATKDSTELTSLARRDSTLAMLEERALNDAVGTRLSSLRNDEASEKKLLAPVNE